MTNQPNHPNSPNNAPSQEAHQDALARATQRKASWARTAAAVFWSFFGVRKNKDHAADIEHLNPLHVIVMGIIGAAIFIAVLLTIVHSVVSG